MTSPEAGGAHELGAVFVNVVPSLANSAEHMRKGGGDAANVFAEEFARNTPFSRLFAGHDFAQHGRIVGEQWSNSFGGAVRDGSAKLSQHMQGSILAAGALGGAIAAAAELATKAFEGVADSAKEVVKSLLEVGDTWEDVQRTLTVRTTAMGADLEGLEDTVRSVASNTSASINDIAAATATLAQRTGLRGGALDELVRDWTEAGKLLGTAINPQQFTAAMHAMGVPMQDADAWLQKLFNIARETGVPFQELLSMLSQNGAALHEFGLDAEPVAALLAQMSSHGINAQMALRGLQSSAREAAKEHKSLSDYLQTVLDGMIKAHDAGNRMLETEWAAKLGRGAAQWMSAVDQGLITSENLSTVLANLPTDRIDELYHRTLTLGDQMKIFANNLSVSLSPIGEALTQEFGAGLRQLSDWVKEHGADIVGWAKTLGDALFTTGEVLAEVAGLFGANTAELRKHLGELHRDFDAHADSIRTTTQVIEDLNGAIGKTTDSKLEIKDNTPEVQKHLDDLKKLGIEVTKGPAGELKFTADTPENAERIEKWIKTNTGKDIKVDVRPQPKTPDGKDYHNDPQQLFPGSGSEIHVKIVPEVDTSHIPQWLKDIFQIPDWLHKNVFPSPPPGDSRDPGHLITPNAPNTNNPPRLLHQEPGSPPGNVPLLHPNEQPPASPPHLVTPPANGETPTQRLKRWFDNAFGWDTGGPVSGIGHRPGPTDTQLSWLDPREFVVRAGPAQRFAGLLDAINRAPGFDVGGPAGGWPLPPTVPGVPIPRSQRDREQYEERQVEAQRTVERAHDRIEDLENSIDDYRETLKDLDDQLQDVTLDEDTRAKLTKQYNRTQQQLNRAIRDHTEAEQDLTTAQRKQVEATETPVGGKGNTGGGAESLGASLVQGMAQELGFGDVWKNLSGGPAKPPWEFGAWRFGAGILGAILGPIFEALGLGGAGGYGALGPGAPSVSMPSVPSGPGSIISLGGAPTQQQQYWWQPHLSAGSSGATPGPGNRPSAASGKAQIAQSIYSAVTGAGYSPKTAQYAVAAGLYESGLNPNQWELGGSDHYGLFQESGDKPRSGVGQQIGWFLSALAAAGGPSVVDADPANVIANRVEAGGYSGSVYDSMLGQARGLLSSGGGYGVPAPVAPVGFAGGGIGVNPATAAGALRLGAGNGSTTGAFDDAVRRGVETNAPLYALGLNTGGYGHTAGLPQWAIDLGAQYGLAPSTYPEGGTLHQRGYAMDFAPIPGNSDPAGSMDRFAQMIATNLGPQTLELIHENSKTGQHWGIAGGRPVGPGTDMPGYFSNDWAGHDDYGPDAHVHWATDVPPILSGMAPPSGGAAPSYTPAGFGGAGIVGALGAMLQNAPRALAQLTPAAIPAAMNAATPVHVDGPGNSRGVTPGPTINIDASGLMHPAQVGQAVAPYVTPGATAQSPTPPPAMAGGAGVPL